MVYIANAKVVLETGILWNGTIGVEGERIACVGGAGDVPIPEGAPTIDAGGLYVGPGLVDIHVHGSGSHAFHEAPEQAAAHFLRHGETTVLPTLYHDLNPAEFVAAIERVKAARARGGAAAAIGGLYMEGPYLNPQYGAMPEKHRWRFGVKAEDYRQIVDRAGDFARVWAFSPEMEGVEDFVRYAKEVNPRAAFALAHSEATPAQARRFKRYGLKIKTHCMNATGRAPVPRGTRGSGPDEFCLSDPDVYAELISDSEGIHVCADQQRLILRAKGVDRVILITDSTKSDGTSPERLRHIRDLNFDANGDLCGSKLTLDVACRNIMAHTGCGIAQAFLMAARNPADAVGLGDEVGTIEAGKRANLVFVDDMFHVNRVILNGETVAIDR